mmetsp:Transcript_14668/g.33992  ORF Transcript_14668/g.33992 Transcript_14668/m.33992 type:complete len:308 (+) Transcript_14668:1401-2324(+)
MDGAARRSSCGNRLSSAGTTRSRSTDRSWDRPTNGWPTCKTIGESLWESCGDTGRHARLWERCSMHARRSSASAWPRRHRSREREEVPGTTATATTTATTTTTKVPAIPTKRPRRRRPRSFRLCTTLPTFTASPASHDWLSRHSSRRRSSSDRPTTKLRLRRWNARKKRTTAGFNWPVSAPPLATFATSRNAGWMLGMPTWKPCRSTSNSRRQCPRIPETRRIGNGCCSSGNPSAARSLRWKTTWMSSIVASRPKPGVAPCSSVRAAKSSNTTTSVDGLGLRTARERLRINPAKSSHPAPRKSFWDL